MFDQTPYGTGDLEVGATTDDEHETTQPTEAQWQAYERATTDLIGKLDARSVVKRNHKERGLISGHWRQVDVLIRGSIAGTEISIAVECKNYAKRLGIGAIDEFVGKLLDLSVDKGVIYALNGYTRGARGRADGAKHPRIVAHEFDPHGELPRWQDGLPEFLSFDCPNENCIAGDVSWQEWPQEGGGVLDAGSCGHCGTWAVRCSACDEVTGFFVDDLQCPACEQSYQLIWDRKGAAVQDVVASA